MLNGDPSGSLRQRYWRFRSDCSHRIQGLEFRLTHRGIDRHCNICGWRGSEFAPIGGMPDVQCPKCESKPRHRMLRSILQSLGLPRPGARILHVSPKGERGLTRWFRRLGASYLSIDKGGVWNRFEDGGALLQMDLTDLKLPDASFDFVMCSHVLENIDDDRKAIAEIYPVVAPTGAAALQVQIYGSTTVKVETAAASRLLSCLAPRPGLFQRYEQAGFQVAIFQNDHVNARLLAIHSPLFVPVCIKPEPEASTATPGPALAQNQPAGA